MQVISCRHLAVRFLRWVTLLCCCSHVVCPDGIAKPMAADWTSYGVTMSFGIRWTLWANLFLNQHGQRFGISPTRLSLTNNFIVKFIISDSLPTSFELEATSKQNITNKSESTQNLLAFLEVCMTNLVALWFQMLKHLLRRQTWCGYNGQSNVKAKLKAFPSASVCFGRLGNPLIPCLPYTMEITSVV